jgi:hypothetical protein
LVAKQRAAIYDWGGYSHSGTGEMKNLKFGLAAWLVCFSLLVANEAHAQFDDSAKWVPQSANSIVMIRAKKILGSPLGVQQKWKTERSRAFRSGAAFFPSSTKRLLLASQIDFQFMEPMWNVSVFESATNDVDILDVSKKVNGNLETIGDFKAVVLPSDSYLVQVDKSTLVSMSPANRQMTSRWIRSSMVATANLSPYLTSAVKFADDNADVIVAFDLEGVLNAKEVTARLKELTEIDQNNLEVYAKTLSSIEGLTLGITVRDKITGAVKIDFKENPIGLAKDGKAMLIHSLKKHGMMIDDLEAWTMTTNGNQLLMSGALSAEGFRQIGTLVEQPIKHELVASDSSSGEGAPEVNMATKSQQYFGDIQHVFKQLRAKDLNNLRTYARWFDRYSREIDKLSVLGVDETLQQYGGYVGNSFRDVANSLRGSDLDRTKSVASQQNFGNYYSTGSGSNFNRYGRWGGYNRGINQRNKIIASNLGTQAGANQAKAIMSQVESQTAAVRDAMSQKYKVDF